MITPENGDKMEQHPDKCLMLERWATLEEHLRSSEEARIKEFDAVEISRIREAKNASDRFTTYITSQTIINNKHADMLTGLYKYVYEDGLNTKLSGIEHLAETEIARVEEKISGVTKLFKSRINWMWIGVGAILLMLVRIYFK